MIDERRNSFTELKAYLGYLLRMMTPARKTMELMKMMKLATPNRKTSKQKNSNDIDVRSCDVILSNLD